jgi:predicted short-subunit dehydrogenase-like oxidoreductase (DUF2520 family)
MNIVLLGSGNVATHLGRAFKEAKHEIIQVWSRNLEHARILGKELVVGYTNDISSISPEADLYIVSVSDDYIADVVSAFPHPGKIIVHTSGSTDKNITGLSGVFYPLQTFSKNVSVDFSVLPIAIEAVDKPIETLLFDLASSIGSKPMNLNSDQRKALHVAAVFACNFSNHLYSIANEILEDSGLDFDLIRPLISATAQKIQNNFPVKTQTGPAVRNDQKTLQKHIQFLQHHPTLVDLYEKLSQSIINFNQKA